MAKFIHFLADDLGYGDLACYGNATVRTPVLDQLAADGRRFTHFGVAHPVCSTSRVAWLTGRLPQYFGLWWVDDPTNDYLLWIPPGTYTVYSLLRRSGYRTAHFGKWHLGSARYAGLPTEYGAERWYGHLGGWAGFQSYVDKVQMDQVPPAAASSGYHSDVITDQLLEWLDRPASGTTRVYQTDFYASLWFVDPHEPTIEVEPQASTYYSALTTRQKRYFSHVTRMDWNIGRVVDYCTQRGIAGDVHLVFSSDNGPEPQDGTHPGSAGTSAPWRGLKTHLWEGGVTVPLIVRGPGIAAGSTDGAIRWALDWLPTVLGIAGLPVSDLSGSSLLSATPASRVLLREANQRGVVGRMHTGASGFLTATRDDGWKLMRFAADGSDDRLYDLTGDPHEDTDVGGANPATKAALAAELDAFDASLPSESTAHDLNPGSVSSELAGAQWYEAGHPLPLRASWFYVKPGTSGEIDAFRGRLNTLLGLPRTAPSGVAESAYGSANVAHPTLGGTTMRVPFGVMALLEDPVNRARCTSIELADLDDRIGFRTGAPTV